MCVWSEKKQQFQKWKPKWYWPMVVFCHPLIWLIGILLKIYLPFNYIRWLFNIHSVYIYIKSISIDDGSRQWKYVWRQSSETNLFFFSTLNNMVGIFQSIYAQKKEKERHSRARKKMNCTKCKMYSITLNTHLNWHCWVEASRLFCFITVVDKILAINCPTFKEPNKCECACVCVLSHVPFVS